MKKTKILWYALTIVPIVLLILGYVFPSNFFGSQEAVQGFVASFGAWAPVIFVLITILQVIVTPISHYVVGIAGGYLFGTWYGFLLNWIGRVIGSLIAFFLAKTIGRKILQHVVKKKTLKKYDWVFEKGALVLFLMYFLPLFPDDELSYLAGLSTMSKRLFFFVMVLGHIGGSLGLAYIGSGISTKDPIFYVLMVVTLLAGVLLFLFGKKFF